MNAAIEEIEAWIERYDKYVKQGWSDIEYRRNIANRANDELLNATNEYSRIVTVRDELKKALGVLREQV